MKNITHALFLLLLLPVMVSGQSKLKTKNVILITLDGMRWQEVFTGADSALFKAQQHFKGPNGQAEHFWKNTAEDRRKALLPFFWNEIAANGQLYGNRAHGNKVNVTNNQWFSYPGYNEILTGSGDPRITSNDKNYNSNTTVLEYINQQPAFKGKVAAFTSWDVFPYIINDKRSQIPVSAGLQPARGNHLTATEKLVNELMPRVPNSLGDVRLDGFTFQYALEYLKKEKPRVLYLAFDETDDFAHAGEYGAYLHSAHNADYFIQQLWSFVQSHRQYKDKTTLIITTDHGRGDAASGNWKSHGLKIPEADQIWLAVLGPDTPSMGELKEPGQYHQNQVAKTLAAFLGLDYTNKSTVGPVLTPTFANPLNNTRTEQTRK